MTIQTQQQITKKKINSNACKFSQFFKLRNLKVVDLDYDNAFNNDEDYYFLEEVLKEDLNMLLTEKLKNNDLKHIKLKKPFSYEEFKSLNLKISYDLSYSQSSYFDFRESNLSLKDVLRLLSLDEKDYKNILDYENVVFKIRDYNNLDYENYDGINCNEEEIEEDLNNLNIQKLEEIEEDLKTFLDNLSKVLMNYGYSHIEHIEEDNTLRNGFNDFISENNLNLSIELYDFDYKTEFKKGYVKICSDGNTNLKGLWIKDFKINENEFKTTYKEFEFEVL